jgi:hypothetical protein
MDTQKTQSIITVTLRTFDEIVAASKDGSDPLLKAEKEAELQQGLSKAKVEMLKASGAYETAMITRGSDVAAAVLDLETKTKRYAFYADLYEKVFPNA